MCDVLLVVEVVVGLLFLWVIALCFFFSGYFFFFKQKTAYEMRISDWSSDVCSSDLLGIEAVNERLGLQDADLEIVERGVVVDIGAVAEIGRASCRERVSQYV